MNISLSIGANLGRRAATLREAIRRIAGLPRTRLLAASSFYETVPWGKTDQPLFLNGAVQVETHLAPEDFLHATQDIERALGRVRHEHWGARTIDIDLVYATESEGEPACVVRRDTPELRLPHPYLLERSFVLEPLREIASDLVLEGHSIAYWCEKNAGQGVKKSDELSNPWPLQLIACISQSRGLGNGGKLLFHIPEDLAFFKEQTKTAGSVVIMGRKTWESLPGGKGLAGRTNVVLSRNSQVSSIEKLSIYLEQLHRERPNRPFWLIGGGSIYRQLLPYVRRAFLTEVAADPPADTFLPPLDGFRCIKKRPAKTPGVTFLEYVRVAHLSSGGHGEA
ncbi:MAG: 2-amino-4-hydroxy-6-hydroxymethyldihydropteridine diphosphokinase [Selenomonadaceae bacterium]|nr:2-amino-4-hydroxy-6-hydroxymethyldihydropteridine diphosphokinase [Selenomonadaceae bacterium]